MDRRRFLGLSFAATACAAAGGKEPLASNGKVPTVAAFADLATDPAKVEPFVKTAEEWRAKLSSDAFYVLREKGTERAFTGSLWNHHGDGVYACAGCGLSLFSSGDKFESGTGWPSYTKPIAPGRVGENVDNSFGIRRVEVVCARCDGHLGHVFTDGPKPLGLRYCINSVSLVFRAA